MVERDKNSAIDPLFEVYKLQAEELSRIREQRDRAIRSYIAINAAILAASGALLGIGTFDPDLQALVAVLLCLVGIVASLQWRWSLLQYETMVAQRVGLLKVMEERGPENVRAYPVYSAVDLALQEKDLEPSDTFGKHLDKFGKHLYSKRALPFSFAIAFLVVALVSLAQFFGP